MQWGKCLVRKDVHFNTTDVWRPKAVWMWPFEYLSRLRYSACNGMRAECFSFFGSLYSPSKGQHTLYGFFNGPAVRLLFLENSEISIYPYKKLNLVGHWRQQIMEKLFQTTVFYYFKNCKLNTPKTNAFHILYYTQYIGYDSAEGCSYFTALLCCIFGLLTLPSQPEPCMAWGEGEPWCSHIAAPREPSRWQTERDNILIQCKSTHKKICRHQ